MGMTAEMQIDPYPVWQGYKVSTVDWPSTRPAPSNTGLGIEVQWNMMECTTLHS